MFARMFNYGTILIHGTGGATTPIRNIADPMKFKGAVEGQIEIYEQTDRTVRGGIGSAIQASTP
ncbi:MAG: hypothetical protein M3T55_10730 [Pseudomonadota bacterium]|nr:hypothetical protein [Pseudomonadota bacterium]